MRNLILGAALALVMPATALAGAEDTTPAELARAACKTEKHEMGTKLFKKTYAAKSASKAMKACVDKREPAAEADAKNAAHECKAAHDADPVAFKETYGENENGKNAFGKCVSGKASESAHDEAEDRANAAQSCKALERDDAEEFADAYGTSKKAFGKCVFATAKADDDE